MEWAENFHSGSLLYQMRERLGQDAREAITRYELSRLPHATREEIAIVDLYKAFGERHLLRAGGLLDQPAHEIALLRQGLTRLSLAGIIFEDREKSIQETLDYKAAADSNLFR